MNGTKKVNLVFLFTVIFALVASTLSGVMTSVISNIVIVQFLLQLIILLPSIIYLIAEKQNPFTRLQFKKVSFTTVILSFLLGTVLIPFVSFINALSMLVVKNYLQDATSAILEQSGLVGLLIFLTLVPAVFEETVYRGVIFIEYRKKNLLKALILSGFLFGLIHMNVNQFIYAFLLGILLAMLVEVTDSIIPAMILHFSLNGTSMTLAWVNSKLESPTSIDNYTNLITLDYILKVLGPVAIVSVVISAIIFTAIVKVNKSGERLKQNLKNSLRKQSTMDSLEKSEKLISIPLIIAIFLCICFMIVIELYSRYGGGL